MMYVYNVRVSCINTNKAFWGYEQGNDTRDPTFQQIGDYYGRLVAWYTNGNIRFSIIALLIVIRWFS